VDSIDVLVNFIAIYWILWTIKHNIEGVERQF